MNSKVRERECGSFDMFARSRRESAAPKISRRDSNFPLDSLEFEIENSAQVCILISYRKKKKTPLLPE